MAAQTNKNAGGKKKPDAEKAISYSKHMKAHLGKMEAKLNHWGAKLEALAARADTQKSAGSGDFHKHIDALIVKHRTLRSKLDELRTAGSDKVEAIKSAIDVSWDDLQGAIKQLTIRFQNGPTEK